MRIAIVGAGFSGLAVCWHLQQIFSSASITVYAPKGVYGGASNVSVGLLHPYAGAHAKYNWLGKEGMQATQELLSASQKSIDRSVFVKEGMLRLALTPEQIADYRQAADLYEDVEWYDASTCQQLIPGLPYAPGIKIHSAITVYASYYLEGLWNSCCASGATMQYQSIDSLTQLQDYDVVVVATGETVISYAELSHLSVKAIKGQILEVEWPEGVEPLPCPLNSRAYIVMSQDRKKCFIGSTYEKKPITLGADLQVAMREILPKAYSLFSPLASAKITHCIAGYRAVTPNHLPLIKQINKRLFVITGMGSKGLLYHALMAQQLVKQIRLLS